MFEKNNTKKFITQLINATLFLVIMFSVITYLITTLFMAYEKRASSVLVLDDAACFCLEKSRRIFVQQKETNYYDFFFRHSNVII